MTSKTKLSIFVIAGIVALASVSAATMLDLQNNTTTQTVNQPDLPEMVPPVNEDGPKVWEGTTRTGVPILQATPLHDAHPLKTQTYPPIKEGTNEYLWRAVDSGATMISLGEMELYFTEYLEKGITKFEMIDSEGTSEYWRIKYQEPRISADHNWVKVFPFSEEYNINNAKSLQSVDAEKFSSIIAEEYTWQRVDDTLGAEIKQILERDGKNITINGQDMQIMYIGKLSEELSKPEIREMYPQLDMVEGEEIAK